MTLYNSTFNLRQAKSVSIGPISQQTVRFDGRCEAVAVARPL